MNELLTKIKPRRIALVAALALSGCAATTGNGFAANEGECVPYETTLTLEPGQKIYVATSDMSFKSGGQVMDKLTVANVEGDLKISTTKESSDELKVESDQVDMSAGDEILIDTSNNEASVNNTESGDSVRITGSPMPEQIVEVQLTQTCKT